MAAPFSPTAARCAHLLSCTVMRPDEPTARTAAATEAAAEIHAAAAARDDRKRRKALRIVRAAIRQGLIEPDDLTTDDETLEVSA